MDELSAKRKALVQLVAREFGLSLAQASNRVQDLRASGLQRDIVNLPFYGGAWEPLQDEETGEVFFMADVDPADSAPAQ